MNSKIEKQIDKANAFDDLAKMYYCRNFGTKSKSEVDVLMFKVYLDAATKAATDKNGELDENKISDYKLGRDLGLTPARVRNLRLKVDLLYQDDFDWKQSLAEVLANRPNLHYENKYFRIAIRNQNLFNAIEDWVEDNGDVLDLTLNSKEMRIHEDQFIRLMDEVFNNEQWHNIKKNLYKKAKKEIRSEKVSDKVLYFSEIAVNLSEVVANIADMADPTSSVCRTLKNVLNVIKNRKIGGKL